MRAPFKIGDLVECVDFDPDVHSANSLYDLAEHEQGPYKIKDISYNDYQCGEWSVNLEDKIKDQQGYIYLAKRFVKYEPKKRIPKLKANKITKKSFTKEIEI